ncbi:MAG TPA: hypothetical protein VEP89_12675, partial [Draconibacterium sp.]|nr:hypothetical protein [Draconibacterium sp.]
MVLFYSDTINPRIEYIGRLIFENILKTEIIFTQNSDEFRKTNLPKVNYSYDKFDNEFYIKPHKLIFQNALIKPSI